MTQLRLIAAAALVLVAGVAHASSTYLTQEEARVAAAKHVGPPTIDLTRPAPGYHAALQRAFQVPQAEQGRVLAAAASTTSQPAPTQVDDRYRR